MGECEGEAKETVDCTGGSCASTSSGVIQSTNYPANYPNKDDLRFPLEVAAGSTIQLTFQDFSLEPTNGCCMTLSKCWILMEQLNLRNFVVLLFLLLSGAQA